MVPIINGVVEKIQDMDATNNDAVLFHRSACLKLKLPLPLPLILKLSVCLMGRMKVLPFRAAGLIKPGKVVILRLGEDRFKAEKLLAL